MLAFPGHPFSKLSVDVFPLQQFLMLDLVIFFSLPVATILDENFDSAIWAWGPEHFGHQLGTKPQSRPPSPSTFMSYWTEISKVSNVSKTMFGRPSCVPGSCVQSFSPLTVRVSL